MSYVRSAKGAALSFGALLFFLLGILASTWMAKPYTQFCPTGIDRLDDQLARAFLVGYAFELRGRADVQPSNLHSINEINTQEIRQWLPQELVKDEASDATTENMIPHWVYVASSSYGTRKLTLSSLRNCGYLVNFGQLIVP